MDGHISSVYIIANVGNIKPHMKGWGNTPEEKDSSLSANIERIRIAKNDLYSHVLSCSMSDTDFSKRWTELSKAIEEIEQYQFPRQSQFKDAVEHLFMEGLDAEMEQKYIKILQKMSDEEKDVKDKIEEMKCEIGTKVDAIPNQVARDAGYKDTRKSRAEIQKSYKDRLKEKDNEAYLKKKERERRSRNYVPTAQLSKKEREERNRKNRKTLTPLLRKKKNNLSKIYKIIQRRKVADMKVARLYRKRKLGVFMCDLHFQIEERVPGEIAYPTEKCKQYAVNSTLPVRFV